jgi:hypothetical protein
MWIARNKYGELKLYLRKPIKRVNEGIWFAYDTEILAILPDNYFLEVKWEDEEPKELVSSSPEEKEESCEDNRGLLHCNNCGGTNILKHAWVDANTLEFAQEDWANNEYWCEDCNEIVDIAEEEETNESNKDIC